MDARERSEFTAHRLGPVALFAPQRPDHTPPQVLSDDELARSVATLHRKLHSARRSHLATQIASVTVTLVVVALVATLVWFGPEPFLERVFGHARVATTYDVGLWWFAVIVLAIFGAFVGDQLVRGRLRLVRGWKHRVDELDRRLSDAAQEQKRRAAS
jgi:hypothetical protein